MNEGEPAVRYVVSRLRWRRNFWNGYRRSPGEVTLVSFATSDAADADRWARERRAREWVNPFECGEAVHHWTSLDEPRLRDWLMDRGIDPPAPGADGKTAWAKWWAKNHKRLGDEKRAAVWEVLDRVRFYTFAARPVRPVVYAVVKIDWEYNDQWQVSYDHGEVQTAYRRREAADAACEQANTGARRAWDGIDMFDMGLWTEARCDLFAKPPADGARGYREHLVSHDAVPFYEVIELELEEADGPRA